MAIDEGISEETHRVLGEEFEDYDPEAVEAAAETWVENAPPTVPDASGEIFEVVETDAGDWCWRLLGSDGTPIVESGRTFPTGESAFEAVGAFQESVGDAPVLAEEPF